MRLFKNRLFLSGLCLALSGFLAFVVIPEMYADKSATTTVIQVSEILPMGSLIAETNLIEVKLGSFGLPATAIKDKKELIGKYAKTDLYKGDLILAEKVSDYRADVIIDGIMKADQRLVTVSLPSIAAGLSSHLMKGDIISVVSYIPEKDQQSMEGYTTQPGRVLLYPELQRLKVYGVENAHTESTEEVKTREKGSNTLNDDPVPKTVTLIATEAQSLKLIEAEYTGKLHIVFVKRGGN